MVIMNNKILFIAACAAVAALSGCTNEAEEMVSLQPEGKSVTLSAGFGPSTRLAISDEGKAGIAFKWEDGDYLSVIDQNYLVTKFSLKEGAGSNEGQFEGKPSKPYGNGQTISALFSKNANAPVVYDKERGGILIDLSGQDGTLNEKYQYMFGQTTIREGVQTAFGLKHLVNVLKVNLTLPSDVKEVESITFSDGSNQFAPWAYVMLQDGVYGDSEYKIGDLVRKGWSYKDVQYEWGYNAEGTPGDTTLNVVTTLKGAFTPVNNVITKYFYALAVRNQVDLNTPNAWGEVSNRLEGNGLNPRFWVKSSDGRLLLAESSNGRDLWPGEEYELNLAAAPLETIELGKPHRVLGNYLGEDGYWYPSTTYYAFSPKESGYYNLGWNFECIFGSMDRSSDATYLVGGETYAFRFYEDSEVTFTKVPELKEGVEQNVLASKDNTNLFLFTPSTTDWYEFKGLEEGDGISWHGSLSQYNSYYLLEAGTTYRFMIWTNTADLARKITVTKVPTKGELSVGEYEVKTSVRNDNGGYSVGNAYKLDIKPGTIYKVELENCHFNGTGIGYINNGDVCYFMIDSNISVPVAQFISYNDQETTAKIKISEQGINGQMPYGRPIAVKRGDCYELSSQILFPIFKSEGPVSIFGVYYLANDYIVKWSSSKDLNWLVAEGDGEASVTPYKPNDIPLVEVGKEIKVAAGEMYMFVPTESKDLNFDGCPCVLFDDSLQTRDIKSWTGSTWSRMEADRKYYIFFPEDGTFTIQ